MTFPELAHIIMSRADALAAFSEMDGGICRRFGTPEMSSASEQAATWMCEAGMRTAIDPFGNLVGILPAAEGSRETRPFVVGGHLDSVRDAGRYDGVLGVLTGIAVAEWLGQQPRRFPFPLQVIAFADEEGLRYQSLGGSQAWAGLPMTQSLNDLDADGISLREAVQAAGGDPDALSARQRPDILGFLETHIEQGPVLQAKDLPVGVVSSIVGSERMNVTLDGMAGHAGTVPMTMRRDALTAAAEIVLAIERIASATPDMVGTVGQLDVHPGASNVIPGKVRLSCEVRHPSIEACQHAIAAIKREAEEIGVRRGVTPSWQDVPGYTPTQCDPALIDLLGEAIAAQGIPVLQLPSGAGHDAINVSQIAPVSMLFVRCKDGISHNPAELIDVSDVEVAIRVMAAFLDSVQDSSPR